MNSKSTENRMSTVNHHEIYRTRAQMYDLLVKCEDYQSNLKKALWDIYPEDGFDMVELGTGTGRLTCMLAPRLKAVYAFDLSKNMLKMARTNLQKYPGLRWSLAVCDHLDLPVRNGIADLVISGWSVCYALVGEPDEWKGTLDNVLSQMARALNPGGVVIIIETMGTGVTSPNPPAGLLPYFQILDNKGFQHTWVRTDYKFQGMGEAEELTSFFFGEEMLAKLVPADGRITLPECTGIWWIQKMGLP